MMKKCKIIFPVERSILESGVEWPPPTLESESLWGELVSDSQARVLNSPFFAKGISFKDIVKVAEQQGKDPSASPNIFDFAGVVRHSGSGTIRVIQASDDLLDVVNAAISEVEKLGCTWEGGDEGGTQILSIDVPARVDSAQVLRILTPAARRGAIWIDIGYLPALADRRGIESDT